MQRVDAIPSARDSITSSLLEMAAVANNVANMRTARPPSGEAFRGQRVIRGGGIVPIGTPDGVLESEPEHPAADAAGFVRMPNIDLGGEMVELMTAQRTIEANVAAIHTAVDSYRDLLAVTNHERARLTESGG